MRGHPSSASQEGKGAMDARRPRAQAGLRGAPGLWSEPDRGGGRAGFGLASGRPLGVTGVGLPTLVVG